MSENSADIGKQQIAAVYAKALIGASEKTGTTSAVADELARAQALSNKTIRVLSSL